MSSVGQAVLAEHPQPPKQQTPIEKVSKFIKDVLTKLEGILLMVPGMVELERSLKLPRVQIFFYSIAGLIYVILVICNIWANFLTYALGFIYPATQSLKAAETGKKEEYQKWLAFWVIFGALTLVEYTDQALLTMLPFYYFFKLLLIVWLLLPYFNGAFRMYHAVLKYMIPTEKKPEKLDDPLAHRFGSTTGGSGGTSAPSSSVRKWGYVPLTKVSR